MDTVFLDPLGGSIVLCSIAFAFWFRYGEGHAADMLIGNGAGALAFVVTMALYVSLIQGKDINAFTGGGALWGISDILGAFYFYNLFHFLLGTATMFFEVKAKKYGNDKKLMANCIRRSIGNLLCFSVSMFVFFAFFFIEENLFKLDIFIGFLVLFLCVAFLIVYFCQEEETRVCEE